jgi:hypothetical protein
MKKRNAGFKRLVLYTQKQKKDAILVSFLYFFFFSQKRHLGLRRVKRGMYDDLKTKGPLCTLFVFSSAFLLPLKIGITLNIPPWHASLEKQRKVSTQDATYV